MVKKHCQAYARGGPPSSADIGICTGAKHKREINFLHEQTHIERQKIEAERERDKSDLKKLFCCDSNYAQKLLGHLRITFSSR